jgi:hypothetical protein
MTNRFGKTVKQFSVIAWIFICPIILFNSCTRFDQSELGGDLLPGSDRLWTDTMMLPVSTISSPEADTSVVNKNEQHVIGFTNDPIFGTTTAATFLQCLPLSYPFKLPTPKDSLFLDSLVLTLAFSGSYGDTSALSSVHVYKVNDPAFLPGKRYTIAEAPAYSNTDLLGTSTFRATEIRKGYKLAYKSDSIFNQLRIRLSDPLGRALLDQDNITGAFTNDSLFKVFLNGFAIVPDSLGSGNALHYFSLSNGNTSLQLYYRVLKPDNKIDTTRTVFPFIPDVIRSANANKIHRNYAGSLSESVLKSGEPSSMAYIQTAPGTAVKIQVPGLDTLGGKPYIVHRAELVARQIYKGPLQEENAFLPPVLHLYTLENSGKNAPIPYDSIGYFQQSSFDFTRSVTLYNILSSYTGGTNTFYLDNANRSASIYRMNMTRYVQNIVNGRTSRRDFKLAAPYFAEFSGGRSSGTSLNPLAYGRIQLGGGSHPLYPMYVCIYYSKP